MNGVNCLHYKILVCEIIWESSFDWNMIIAAFKSTVDLVSNPILVLVEPYRTFLVNGSDVVMWKPYGTEYKKHNASVNKYVHSFFSHHQHIIKCP